MILRSEMIFPKIIILTILLFLFLNGLLQSIYREVLYYYLGEEINEIYFHLFQNDLYIHNLTRFNHFN